MNLEPEKNIQLTVIQPADQEDEISIDLYQIAEGFKRFLALWLVLAIALGALAMGIGLVLRKSAYTGDAMTLIEYVGEDAQIDATRLQMPAIVGTAMTNLGLDIRDLDAVRSNLTITGVMSDETYDQMTLYYNLLSKNTANMDTVQSLLDANNQATRYIISFNYHEAKYTREDGVRLLNEIVSIYRDYYENNYNYNAALGSAINVVDYKNYDYAEAVNVFSSVLDSIEAYVTAVSNNNTIDFRSAETGYSFKDLLNNVEMLRGIELDRISSFITINSVTSKDPATEIAHYEWLIENQNREKGVLEAKLTSLTASISSYEKDPVVYAAGESIEQKKTDKVDAYDAMILEKLTTQEQISQYNKTIRYYESVIEKLNQKSIILQANNDTAEAYLTSFNEKITQLVDVVNTTVNEYYDKAVLTNSLQVLVPAIAKAPKITDGGWIKTLAIVEVLLVLCYCAAAVIYGLRVANPRKEEPLKPQVNA